ncbi:MAG: hypothetical protein AAFV07_16325, partial [Bacteroidota bacterium]
MSFSTFIRTLGGLLLISGLVACKHAGPGAPPVNPYDAIEYPDNMIDLPAPDSNTIVGLHQYIFSQSCAVPGCHDGHFEPDFRTVQSTYSTLVFQPVVKNTEDEAYDMRVVPFKPEESWLFNRVTTDDQILGRMPLYDNPLTSGQVEAISNWIDAGAPDMFGTVSAYPNTQPVIRGVAAFLEFQGVPFRVDTIRDQPTSPFGTLNGRDMEIWFALEDDSTALSDLKNTRIEFASGLNQILTFNATLTELATYSTTPKVLPDYFGSGETLSFYWKVTINTSLFPVNDVTFMRLYTDDGSGQVEYYFPRNEHP